MWNIWCRLFLDARILDGLFDRLHLLILDMMSKECVSDRHVLQSCWICCMTHGLAIAVVSILYWNWHICYIWEHWARILLNCSPGCELTRSEKGPLLHFLHFALLSSLLLCWCFNWTWTLQIYAHKIKNDSSKWIGKKSKKHLTLYNWSAEYNNV